MVCSLLAYQLTSPVLYSTYTVLPERVGMLACIFGGDLIFESTAQFAGLLVRDRGTFTTEGFVHIHDPCKCARGRDISHEAMRPNL